MNAEQARMARALLNLEADEIAASSGLTTDVLWRVENGLDTGQIAISAVRGTYIRLGVQFLERGQGGCSPTVSLVRP